MDGGPGAPLDFEGQKVEVRAAEEYYSIYRQFAALVRSRRSEVDAAPLRIITDAFTMAKHMTVKPFHE